MRNRGFEFSLGIERIERERKRQREQDKEEEGWTPLLLLLLTIHQMGQQVVVYNKNIRRLRQRYSTACPRESLTILRHPRMSPHPPAAAAAAVAAVAAILAAAGDRAAAAGPPRWGPHHTRYILAGYA